MLLDFQDNSIEYMPVALKSYSFVVVNSHINRELSESAYMNRVKECEEGLTILKKECNISTFREIELEMLDVLQNKNELYYKRLYHYVHENRRVLAVKECLQLGNAQELGNMLNESHESLRDMYEVSCSEIDYIIEISKEFDGWCGGRIMGGGFGGSTIHILSDDVIDSYSRHIVQSYCNKFGISPQVFPVSFSGGLETLQLKN